MNPWEILDIEETDDKERVKAALAKRIREADFSRELDQVFNCLRAYDSIEAKAKSQITESKLLLSQKQQDPETNEALPPYLDSEGPYRNPEALINRFEKLYDNIASRYHFLSWKSAVANMKLYTTAELETYCGPIYKFLNHRCYLKSDVLMLLWQNFPFSAYFSSLDADLEESKKTVVEYRRYILKFGNMELDLQINHLLSLGLQPFQLDIVLSNLSQSSILLRKRRLIDAYKILSRNIPGEAKPLIIWQREINILFRAVFVEKQHDADRLLAASLNDSLQLFPRDTQLLYQAAAYTFYTQEPESALETIVQIIKNNPINRKSFYFLGRCYLQLNRKREACDVFRNLAALYPSNVEYAAYAAVAGDLFPEEHMQEGAALKNSQGAILKNPDQTVAKFENSNQLSKSRLWLIATAAMLARFHSERLDTLLPHERSAERMCEGRRILNNDWGICNLEDLSESMEYLHDMGTFAPNQDAYELLSELEFQAVDSLDERFDEKKHILRMLHAYQFNLHPGSDVAWHFGRCSWLIRQAVYVNYIKEDEAWALLEENADRIRLRFSSWIDFGISYAVGAQFWLREHYTEASMKEYIDDLKFLLANGNSPWQHIGWNDYGE